MTRPGRMPARGARAARFGVVHQAALDLRREPDHRAELTSQLLMGEVVQILRRLRGGEWLRVANLTDGYRGWAPGWGLTPASATGAARWRRRARARVGVLFAEARSGPGAGHLLTPLLWNSTVVPGLRRGRHQAVLLPDGRRAWVLARSLLTGPKRPGLASRVRGLLGIPYLWGGRTPLGFDCSGLAQQLLGEQGVSIPRDTAEQIRRCRPLATGEPPAVGDLTFFRARSGGVGHVGVGLGSGYFVHSRGVVRISAADRSNQLYDNALKGTELGWFRPLKGGRQSAQGRTRLGPRTPGPA